MGLSDSERISMILSAVLIQYTRVTDGRTDRRTELAWHIRAIAYMLSRVKIIWSRMWNCGRDQGAPGKVYRQSVLLQFFKEGEKMYKYYSSKQAFNVKMMHYKL